MNIKRLRVLGVIRLSDVTDETTSPERQREKIESWAKMKDWPVVGWAEDLDVSGAVAPFQREELGRWLTAEARDTWDVVVVMKMDRLTRSLADFLDFYRWCEKYEKSIASVTENVDMTTPQGRAFVQMIIMFAEFERETISARVKDAYDYAVKQGRYFGMQVPFGLRTVGNRYEHDPKFAPIVVEMADRLLAGQSLNQIARWLNDSGIPTSRNIVRTRKGKKVPKDSAWKSTTVRKVLRGHGILGEIVVSGITIKRCEPIIPHDRWAQAQAILDQNVSAPRVDSSPMLGIVFCTCGETLYQSKQQTAGKLYRYYGHKATDQCQARKVPAEYVESEIRDTLINSTLGRARYKMMQVIPGKSNSARIAQLAQQIGSLSSQLATDRAYKRDVSAGQAELERMQAELDELADAGTAEDQIDYIDTGKTYAQIWAERNNHERNVMLRSLGIKATAYRDSDGPHVRVTGFPELEWINR